MPTGEMTDQDSVKKRLAEGRELTKPFAPPPPPPPPAGPKASGSQEGPDKRQMRYLLRRALFAFEEALGLYSMIGNIFPELQRVFNVVNLPQVLTNIIVALRDKLVELHDEGEPMAQDVPRDDGEQLAMKYLGEIQPPLLPDPAEPNITKLDEELTELSRRLGAIPASARVAAIRKAMGRMENSPTIGSFKWQEQNLRNLPKGQVAAIAEIPDSNPKVGGRNWLIKTIHRIFNGSR